VLRRGDVMATRLRAATIFGMFVVVATLIVGAWLGGPRSWGDVAVDRGALAPESQRVFGLILAMHGRDGPSWPEAEGVCRWLGWPRCDREALEELARRTRPPRRGTIDGQVASALAVADATWGFGSEDAVRKMLRVELDRIPESDGVGRARAFVRFGVIESNPDGQAPLFAQACVADQRLCDQEQLRQAAQREVRARFVPPGNVVPLYFSGHP